MNSPSFVTLGKSKPITITIIAIIIVVLLVLFGRQFVGRAIFTGTVGATFTVDRSTENSNVVVLSANTGSDQMMNTFISVAVPGGDICSLVGTVVDAFGTEISGVTTQVWGGSSQFECIGGVLYIEDLTLDESKAKSGSFPIAQLAFPGGIPGSLVFQRVNLFAGGVDLFPSTQEPFTVSFPQNGAPADGDNDGVLDNIDNCPAIANVNQADANQNNIGDACDTQPCGVNAILSTASCDCVVGFSNMNGVWNDGCETSSGGTCPGSEALCTEAECVRLGRCTIDDAEGSIWFRGLTNDALVRELCAAKGITPGECPAPTIDADINDDSLIDDRDALFIFQAIEAKQSAYNYCGEAGQPPCVFSDRAICEDVSYAWTLGASRDHRVPNIFDTPVLPTPATSNALAGVGLSCPVRKEVGP